MRPPWRQPLRLQAGTAAPPAAATPAADTACPAPSAPRKTATMALTRLAITMLAVLAAARPAHCQSLAGPALSDDQVAALVGYWRYAERATGVFNFFGSVWDDMVAGAAQAGQGLNFTALLEDALGAGAFSMEGGVVIPAVHAPTGVFAGYFLVDNITPPPPDPPEYPIVARLVGKARPGQGPDLLTWQVRWRAGGCAARDCAAAVRRRLADAVPAGPAAAPPAHPLPRRASTATRARCWRAWCSRGRRARCGWSSCRRVRLPAAAATNARAAPRMHECSAACAAHPPPASNRAACTGHHALHRRRRHPGRPADRQPARLPGGAAPPPAQLPAATA